MMLTQEKLLHINSITHEGKIVLLATNPEGKIFYTVKQDGFEDSYLNTPPEQRTGWEGWQELELPDDQKDISVVNREKAELTYPQDSNQFILRSRYKTKNDTASVPVQIVSALGHIYIFRQSQANTLLVDRYVLDGMINKLNRKLEVRFKRSRQKYAPTENMNRGVNGLTTVDSLDFRDANGKPFYEPTTELSLIKNLHQGWFSVVLVPTLENDVYRWHIFAYNSKTQKVELTTLRASQEGLFDVQDYTLFEEVNETLIPRQIPGVIKRTLDLDGVTVTNGLAATQYNVQQEQETQTGEKQLLKTATRLMLAVPTREGTATLSFAIAGDGTLAEIDETPDRTVLRSQQQEVLLPLNTLDEIKAFADRTPPPQGVITGFAEGTQEDDVEDLVTIATQGKASELSDGDLVKITATQDYQGLYRTQKIDENTFEIDIFSENGLGYWEQEDEEEGGLIFDGMITAYQKTADGKLRVTCPHHGLDDGDEVQIIGTEDYNNTYPVQKLDDTHFVIERKWPPGEAIQVKKLSQKRRGLVFDGVDDYVALPEMNHNFSQGLTIEAWVWYDSFKEWSRIVEFSNGPRKDPIDLATAGTSPDLRFFGITAQQVLEIGQWIHLAVTVNASGTATLYKNGQAVHTGNCSLPTQVTRTKNYIGRSSYENRNFHGKISDVRLWKVARTAKEIKNNMYLPQTGKELGLVGYWRLGAIAEGKVVDFSAGCNDGTVFGDTYVSATTLPRQLAGGTQAVKYANPELFPVSQGSTYEESFEFKVNTSTAVDLDYLNNADGKGNKIFTLAYWGKNSRSAEEKTPVSAVQNQFEDLGKGWYRVSATITIPEAVSLLRSFEIADVKGNWDSLEIRKHCIRFLSNSITEVKYSDEVTLETLADAQETLVAKLNQLTFKEKQEADLLAEKQELEAKLAAYNAQEGTRAKIKQLEVKIATLEREGQTLSDQYKAEVNSPFNYYCLLSCQAEPFKYVQVIKRNHFGLELVSQGINGYQKVKFTPTWDGFYLMSFQSGRDHNRVQVVGRDRLVLELVSKGINGWQKAKFTPTEDGFYTISFKNGGYHNRVQVIGRDYLGLELVYKSINNWQKFKLTPTREQTNNNISVAEQALQKKQQELKQAKIEKQKLESTLVATPEDKEDWLARFSKIWEDISKLQTEINSLNAEFLNGIQNAQIKPQTMPQVAQDDKDLVIQGALLSFVKPVSRLKALATCEGNIQLSYFDAQGRMRQTCYDATADSNNAAFEQWLPDAQRACLNFNQKNSVVTLSRPIFLYQDWTIEAWFAYPLPETEKWNTLTKGQHSGHQVLVKNGKQLGIYISNDPLDQSFYDSGFNMESLSEGWHHLTAVGRGETTLFYIDGKPVGDIKAKAVADAEKTLEKAPNDEAAKKKVEDLKKATLKVTSDVYKIGNFTKQPFGKVAEVRIWDVALSEAEVAINSKTLLTGNEPGLLAYYPFNEATGTTVKDHCGSGNDGTISAANWWGCTAPIGNVGHTVLQFDGLNDYVALPQANYQFSQGLTVEIWVRCDSFKEWSRIVEFSNGPGKDPIDLATAGTSPDLRFLGITAQQVLEIGRWIHLAVTVNASGTATLYKNGQAVHTGNCSLPAQVTRTKNYIGRSSYENRNFHGQIADVRLWTVARSQDEIQADLHKRLSGDEPNLAAYYPLNEIVLEENDNIQKVKDWAGDHYGTVHEALMVDSNTLPIGGDALVSSEYSTVTLQNNRKSALMRRFFAYPSLNGVTLLPDKRIETLELKWIGNAQFAPTLLGYIEGPPPVPSENLTLEDDYNGATSVELTMSEDVDFSWNRAQDSGLGGMLDTYIGGGGQVSFLTAPMGVGTSIETKASAGFKGDFDFTYQFQNESNITSSSSLSMTDTLELRGTPEETEKFPHLGKRFIPKNIGYALVVSALADVFVTRLTRSGKMVGYQVQPAENIPPDVNTITFLMNPAYTMNGSLDGLTGSSATSDRFFKHVPEMRSQYGSLYPASYYRLQEAYDLKQQIEAEDKRRESYFSSFNVHLVDEASLDRNIDQGDAPATIGVNREEDKLDPQMTDEEKKQAQDEIAEQFQAGSAAASDKTKAAAQVKQTEIQSKIDDQEKRVQATEAFASWQKRMEDLQIRASKRNIVNTYVWDADGGLRTEAQSFANTVEHTIGGSYTMNAGLGLSSSFSLFGADVELTAQTTVNLTQTMSKTEARSKGFELNVDLSGLEFKGITDHNDKPILPGEKVDRYRFMSFYLEGNTRHFQDFFSYVVDPEWLASNDEEARALRQAQAGKPNKAWRVLHRVTYVERPALMGFGHDVRTLHSKTAATSANQLLLAKIAKLEEENRQLEEKLDLILKHLNA